MTPSREYPRDRSRTFFRLSIGLTVLSACFAGSVFAQSGPGEGKQGLVDLGAQDARLKGHFAPEGFQVKIVASEPLIIDPTAMAFDDDGNLYVAEWKRADKMFDTSERIKLPEGGTARIKRRRKGTNDVVKRLRDLDGDGVYDRADVVVEGAEMPSSIFPWKNSLYLTCVGRLERWSDEDGNGDFETKTVIADGFCGFYHHWLSGMTLNSDGWFYLTAGDNDNHVVGSDGSRVEVSRCGGVFRGRVDGSNMHLFALGFRNPYRDLAFDSRMNAFLVDNDNEDGSKFQGVRLINAVEEGDYGWRLRPGADCCVPDFDRGAVNGELPGKLPIVAKTGRGAPAGLTFYHGQALPERYRDLAIYPDVFRKLVRGYRLKPQGGANVLDETMTLMTADDDLFRPCQAVVGPDGALYVLDWRSNSGGAGRLWGDGRWGRLYRLGWSGDRQTPALPLKPNNWKRVTQGTDDQLKAMIQGGDYHEARRALRELVSRGGKHRPFFAKLLNDKTAPSYARLLGLQGLRQLWDESVEREMVGRLDDPSADVRRLAAQALSWEPTERRPGLVPTFVAHLNERDGHVLRELALAIGRHGWSVPFDAAPTLTAWLLAHPDEDVVTRDAFIRGLERLGDPGVEEIARLIRSGQADERAKAVAIYSAFRTAPAAKRLPDLVKTAGLTSDERLALVKMFKDIPLNIPTPTEGLADFVAEHPEFDPAIKRATLEVCLLAGNPAGSLVLKLLDDRDDSVRLPATESAGRAHPAGAAEKLIHRLSESDRSTPERSAIVRALASFGAAGHSAIEAAYKRFGDDPAFRSVALRALADGDRVRAEPLALEAVQSDRGPLRAVALQILSETPQGALALGRVFLERKLDRADLPLVVAALRRYDTAEHRPIREKIEADALKGTSSLKPAEIKDRVASGGDPWKGLNVFLREDRAKCLTCHRLESVGGNVGPALTGAYQALSIDKLIEALLEPSKEIKEGYESYKVALKDGRVVNGIKVAQDAQALTLKDANGRETRLNLSEIDESAKESISLMPAGLVLDLSTDELVNLLAFLQSKPAQEALRFRTRIEHASALGPLDPAAIDEIPKSAEAFDSPREGGNRSVLDAAWTTLDSNTAGMLNLRGQLAAAGGRALAAVELAVDADQEAALRLGASGPARIYLNGVRVAETAAQGHPEPIGSSVRLPLRNGRNLLVLSIGNSPTGDNRLSLEIDSPKAIVAKPPGAKR